MILKIEITMVSKQIMVVPIPQPELFHVPKKTGSPLSPLTTPGAPIFSTCTKEQSPHLGEFGCHAKALGVEVWTPQFFRVEMTVTQ